MKVFINSQFRTLGESHAFSISCQPAIDATDLVVTNIVIPDSYNNIVDGSNGFSFVNTAGTPINTSIAPGRYTVAQLLVIVQNTFLANDFLPYVVALDANGFVNITVGAGGFIINVDDTSIFKRLGFLPSTAISLTKIAAFPPDIQRTKNIIVESTFSLAERAFCTSSARSGLNDGFRILSTVPVLASPVSQISYISSSDKDLEPIKLINTSYAQVDFVLYDDQHRKLDLNGYNWTIELLFIRGRPGEISKILADIKPKDTYSNFHI